MKAQHSRLGAFVVAGVALAASACTVQPSRGVDEPCDCGEECEAALYCTRRAEQSFDGSCDGEDGVCRAYRGEGEACNEDARDPWRCKAPLFCRPDQVCGSRLSSGEACKRGSDCADGLNCNAGMDPPQCRAPGADGQRCGDVGDCATGLLCNRGVDPGVCAAPGASAAGEPCAEDVSCKAGLHCNVSSEMLVCVEAFSGAEGTPCSRDLDCHSEHCVTWSEGDQGVWIGRCG